MHAAEQLRDVNEHEIFSSSETLRLQPMCPAKEFTVRYFKQARLAHAR